MNIWKKLRGETAAVVSKLYKVIFRESVYRGDIWQWYGLQNGTSRNNTRKIEISKILSDSLPDRGIVNWTEIIVAWRPQPTAEEFTVDTEFCNNMAPKLREKEKSVVKVDLF